MSRLPPLLAILLLACPAAALPLRATFSGQASGTLGGTAFSDATVVIQILIETDDLRPPPVPVPNTQVTDVLQASFQIGGLGTALVTEATLFGFGDNTDGTFFRSADPAVIDFFNFNCGAPCDGWDVASGIGPWAGSAVWTQGPGLATDQGLFEFEPLGFSGVPVPFRFQAVIVPEPSTALLLAGGLVGLAARRRRCSPTTPVIAWSQRSLGVARDTRA